MSTVSENTEAVVANMPPTAYCSDYSSLTGSLYDEAVIRVLSLAAKAPQATCPVTGLTVTTPLQAQAWADMLAATNYPNVAAAVTLVTCIRQGVNLGYFGSREGVAIGPNLLSAAQHADAIDKDMHKQIQLGRRQGPHDLTPAFPFFRSG